MTILSDGHCVTLNDVIKELMHFTQGHIHLKYSSNIVYVNRLPVVLDSGFFLPPFKV